MEISPRRSISLDTSIASLAVSSYPPNSGNWHTNVYTLRKMKPIGEASVQKVPVRLATTLSLDSGSKCPATPKRENFFTSMFGALTSVVAERLGKLPSTFVSNIHNTLSVTVVPNEGIISHDFFKNLTRSYEQLATEKKKDIIENTTETTNKFSNKSMYNIASPMSCAFTSDATRSTLSNGVALNPECDAEGRFNETKSSDSPIICTEMFNEWDVRDSLEESPVEERSNVKENSSTMSDESIQSDVASARPSVIVTNEEKRKRIDAHHPSRSAAVPELAESDDERMDVSSQRCTTGWHTMWHKVVNGMSERFGTSGAVSPDSEVPTKKPNLSKPPRRKTCTVACVRGKGRGKSQLRRNGVSQSRHRKERTKQNIYSNIQDDLSAWEDSEQCHEGSEDDDSTVNDRRSIDQPDAASSNFHDLTDSSYPRCATLLESLPCDVSTNMRKRKQTLRNSASSCPVRVRYVPESSVEVESHDSPYAAESTDSSTRSEEYRPRLVSESSVDSEDSYCIVFEHGSESEYSDYDYDEITDEASDIVSDKEFDDDDKGTRTVRFNLEPEVHKMIKWDYAYRAARRGPWEEMARDRGRFRGRICCVERILNPVLSVQHRNCIWQERFNVDEQSGRTAQALF